MGPAPEFVHADDVAGLVQLCHSLITPRLAWDTPWKGRVKEFKKELQKYRSLLRSGP
jgi:hypothetical protein